MKGKEHIHPASDHDIPKEDWSYRPITSLLLYKNSSESKETRLWFVILIPFYSINTITQLFNKYNNTANTPTIFPTSL
jgi:hypothetical protein